MSKYRFFRPFKIVYFILILILFFQTISLEQRVFARDFQAYHPLILKGVKVDFTHPLHFDFILDPGDSSFQHNDLFQESNQLIKYFLSALTIPEDQMWVNLSPHEKNRIIPESFGQTIMGRDLLEQDYLLKQLTSSLLNPKNEYGRKFWKEFYASAYEKYGTTNISVNDFHKIWIVPDEAEVFTQQDRAIVTRSRLKVKLKEENSGTQGSELSTQILKKFIVPEIEKRINEGKEFATLRKIYHSLILATWYKRNLQQSFLGESYVDEEKIDGIDIEDKNMSLKLYEQYIEAFRKGAFNFIHEDYDPNLGEMIPRKYFSGGVQLDMSILSENGEENSMDFDNALVAQVRLDLNLIQEDRALLSDEQRDLIIKALNKVKSYGEKDEISFYQTVAEVYQLSGQYADFASGDNTNPLQGLLKGGRGEIIRAYSVDRHFGDVESMDALSHKKRAIVRLRSMIESFEQAFGEIELDGIIFNHSMFHILHLDDGPKFEQALSIAQRSLPPGGRIFIKDIDLFLNVDEEVHDIIGWEDKTDMPIEERLGRLGYENVEVFRSTGSSIFITATVGDSSMAGEREIPNSLESVGLLGTGIKDVTYEYYQFIRRNGLVPLNERVEEFGFPRSTTGHHPDKVSLSLSMDRTFRNLSSLVKYGPGVIGYDDKIMFVIDPNYVRENPTEFELVGIAFHTEGPLRVGYLKGLELLGLFDQDVSDINKTNNYIREGFIEEDEIHVDRLPVKAILGVVVRKEFIPKILMWDRELGIDHLPIYVYDKNDISALHRSDIQDHDEAMISDVGGIDLNPQDLDIDQKGTPIQLNTDIKNVDFSMITGVEPIILDITPMSLRSSDFDLGISGSIKD